MAIPYVVTRSTVFFLVATLLLCGGYCSCLVGHFMRHRRLFTFIAGVIFIVSGLVMLFGLIMYISVFKAEVGYKLRPRSQLAPPIFTYRYGYSFLLYVSGFVTTELAGTSAIFLFIYSHQSEWYRQRLKHHTHLHPIHSMDGRKFDLAASGNATTSGIGPTTGMISGGIPHPGALLHTRPYLQSHSTTLHFDHNILYPCRRHPQAYINTNSLITHYPIYHSNSPPIIQQRRYFFNKETSLSHNQLNNDSLESPCSIHRSLKDLTIPPPPAAPATISYPPMGQSFQHEQQQQSSITSDQFQQALHRGTSSGPGGGQHPRDLTSTTTDCMMNLNSNSTTNSVSGGGGVDNMMINHCGGGVRDSDDLAEHCYMLQNQPSLIDDYSPSIQHEFVTFDLDDPPPPPPPPPPLHAVSQHQRNASIGSSTYCNNINSNLPPPLMMMTSTAQQTDNNIQSNNSNNNNNNTMNSNGGTSSANLIVRPSIIRSEFSIDTLRRTTPV